MEDCYLEGRLFNVVSRNKQSFSWDLISWNICLLNYGAEHFLKLSFLKHRVTGIMKGILPYFNPHFT